MSQSSTTCPAVIDSVPALVYVLTTVGIAGGYYYFEPDVLIVSVFRTDDEAAGYACALAASGIKPLPTDRGIAKLSAVLDYARRVASSECTKFKVVLSQFDPDAGLVDLEVLFDPSEPAH